MQYYIYVCLSSLSICKTRDITLALDNFFSTAWLWAKLFQYTSLRTFVCIATATNYFLLRIKGMVLFEIPCRNKLCSLFAKPKPSDSSTIYAIAVRERREKATKIDRITWLVHVDVDDLFAYYYGLKWWGNTRCIRFDRIWLLFHHHIDTALYIYNVSPSAVQTSSIYYYHIMYHCVYARASSFILGFSLLLSIWCRFVSSILMSFLCLFSQCNDIDRWVCCCCHRHTNTHTYTST